MLLQDERAAARVEADAERAPLLEGAPSDIVLDDGFGDEENALPGGPRAAAEVEVLVIEEEALVEIPERLKRGPPHEEARARQTRHRS